uniref:Uncharacterized protein n=1 Tax=Solanum tuberosum TaxID=4113 RepID=M1E1A3_SOLTU
MVGSPGSNAQHGSIPNCMEGWQLRGESLAWADPNLWNYEDSILKDWGVTQQCSDNKFVTPQTQGAQMAPNAKTQARADPTEPFATSAWQPHAIKKTNKYISA